MKEQMAVINAGPLMVLSKLNLLHLLQQNFEKIRFPHAVYGECVTNGIRFGYEDAYLLRRFLHFNDWNADNVPEIISAAQNENLDLGEKEAISLACHHKCLLLMDEERGRKIARNIGIPVRGTLGILIQSYRKRFIDENQLRFYFETIAKRKDIWISPKLCESLLQRIFV